MAGVTKFGMDGALYCCCGICEPDCTGSLPPGYSGRLETSGPPVEDDIFSDLAWDIGVGCCCAGVPKDAFHCLADSVSTRSGLARGRPGVVNHSLKNSSRIPRRMVGERHALLDSWYLATLGHHHQWLSRRRVALAVRGAGRDRG